MNSLLYIVFSSEHFAIYKTHPTPRRQLCRTNQYDGVDEYYVVTREKGSREQEESQEETRKKVQKIEVGYQYIYIYIFERHFVSLNIIACFYLKLTYKQFTSRCLQASSVAIKDGAFDRLGQMHARDAAEKATPREAGGKTTQEEQAGCQLS